MSLPVPWLLQLLLLATAWEPLCTETAALVLTGGMGRWTGAWPVRGVLEEAALCTSSSHYHVLFSLLVQTFWDGGNKVLTAAGDLSSLKQGISCSAGEGLTPSMGTARGPVEKEPLCSQNPPRESKPGFSCS